MLLKLSSSRKASNWARLRAVESHWETNSWALAAARSAGCNSVKVSSLKRKYAVTNFSSRMAAPVKSIMDARSAWLLGISRTSPSPSKERSRDVAVYVFRKGDCAVVEGDVEGGPLERHFADVIDPRFVEAHVLQLQIQSFRGMVCRSLQAATLEAGAAKAASCALQSCAVNNPSASQNSANAWTGMLLITLVT